MHLYLQTKTCSPLIKSHCVTDLPAWRSGPSPSNPANTALTDWGVSPGTVTVITARIGTQAACRTCVPVCVYMFPFRYRVEIIWYVCMFVVYVWEIEKKNGVYFCSRSTFHFLLGMVLLSQHPLCQQHWLALGKHNITCTHTLCLALTHTHSDSLHLLHAALYASLKPMLRGRNASDVLMQPYVVLWCLSYLREDTVQSWVQNRKTDQFHPCAQWVNFDWWCWRNWFCIPGTNLDLFQS